jgi:hypothetical protein
MVDRSEPAMFWDPVDDVPLEVRRASQRTLLLLLPDAILAKVRIPYSKLAPTAISNFVPEADGDLTERLLRARAEQLRKTEADFVARVVEIETANRLGRVFNRAMDALPFGSATEGLELISKRSEEIEALTKHIQPVDLNGVPSAVYRMVTYLTLADALAEHSADSRERQTT